MKRTSRLHVALWLMAGLAALAFAIWMGRDKRLIAEELGVSRSSITCKRVWESKDLGFYHIFFRVDHVDAPTRKRITERHYTEETRNPLTMLIPFRSRFDDEIRDKWWDLPKDRSQCVECVGIWRKEFLVNIIVCGDTVYGFAKSSYNQEATPGPF